MSTEANKVLVHRFFEELWNQGNLVVADELLAPAHVHHFPGEDIHGPDGVTQLVSGLRTALPDFHMSTDDVIAEADKVVMRFTIRGTHQGEGMGLPPTGKRVAYTGIDIFRIAGGKIVERWVCCNNLGLSPRWGRRVRSSNLAGITSTTDGTGQMSKTIISMKNEWAGQ